MSDQLAQTPPEASPDASPETPDKHYLLHVSLKDLLCSIPLEFVDRVLPLMALQKMPSGPAYLAGLMNLHGQSIPVIDLSIRMGLPVADHYQLETPVIVCTYKTIMFALIVDGIIGVDVYSDNELQMQQDDKDEYKAFFDSVINTQQGLSLILDLSMLIKVDFKNSAVEVESLSELSTGSSDEKQHAQQAYK